MTEQTDLREFVESYLSGSLRFEARTLAASAEIRERSKVAYGDTLLDGRLQLLAIAEYVYVAKEGIAGTSSQEINDRLVLLASFFQGVGATEALISEGQYAKAAAALKQDLEMLTRIGETLSGTAKRGMTPNIKYAPAGSGPLYGKLNDVAHPSSPDLLAGLLGSLQAAGGHGVSYVPEFVEQTAVSLYRDHVWLILQMCRELFRIMHDLYGPEPKLIPAIRWWRVVAEGLASAGHIRREL